MIQETLAVLLIEDNPGDARLIEEMLGDAEDRLERVDLGGAPVNGSTVYRADRLADGLDLLSETEFDVVLLDLNLPDCTGLETLETILEETTYLPVVVLTGLRDEQMGVDAIQRGAHDYLVKDELTADLLVRSVHHAIERNRREHEQARRREQLASLNRLNRISHDVTHDVITTSTREELERAVCERLVESDAYRFAWIGEVDRTSDAVRPRTTAGVEEGYLDEVDIAVREGATAQGPTGRAIRTQEVQVAQDILTDPAYETWREEAIQRGYRSSAAVPIVHEELLYGVLNVYASDPNAFSDPVVDILSRLGDVIGHAIAAIERKDALVSDTALELEFRIEDVLEDLLALSADAGPTIEFETLIRSDDAVIVYGRASGGDPDQFRDRAEANEGIDELRILSSNGEECRFELVTRVVDSLFDAVARHGGNIDEGSIADGEFRFVVTFPPGGDKRQLVDLVVEHCPNASLIAQRTVERRDRDVSDPWSVLEDRLTEKQQTALKTAYFGGYFDWPRESTGEELADRLDITPATFSQHLRAAQRKSFDAAFEDDDGDEVERTG